MQDEQAAAGPMAADAAASKDEPERAVPAAVEREAELPAAQWVARLLAEILALDLGNLTPIRALTLLHELQTAAREAVPWTDWMANLAGARDRSQSR